MNICTFQGINLPIEKNSEYQKWQKLQFYNFQIPKSWFHVKSWNSHTMHREYVGTNFNLPLICSYIFSSPRHRSLWALLVRALILLVVATIAFEAAAFSKYSGSSLKWTLPLRLLTSVSSELCLCWRWSKGRLLFKIVIHCSIWERKSHDHWLTPFW